MSVGCHAAHFTTNPGTLLLAMSTCQGHQSHQLPLLLLGQRKVTEAPSLPVDLLSLPKVGVNGQQSLNLYCSTRKEGLSCHCQEGRKTEWAQPWVAKAHCLHPSPGAFECHPTQTTSGWGEGAFLFSTNVTCHKPSQLVPPSKQLVLSFKCLLPTRDGRCEGRWVLRPAWEVFKFTGFKL